MYVYIYIKKELKKTVSKIFVSIEKIAFEHFFLFTNITKFRVFSVK